MSNAVLAVKETEAPATISESAAVLQIIERAARDPSVDIAKMRELLEMRKDMMAFEAERAFDAAMTAAQTEMRPVAVNASNPQTRSKYATFEALDGAIRPIYTKHGFSLSWGTADGAPADHVRVTCRVAHNAGHRQMEHIDMPTDGKGAKGNDVMTKTHATGAAITYGRRYLEGMIFNIAITKDDDGNGANNTGETITADQYQELLTLLEKTGKTEDTLLIFLGLPPDADMHQFTVPQYKRAKHGMQKFIQDHKAAK